ncbi:hypothetical protein [Candidatus Similichlamydia epinepheli]|uniref:hypothetical protein n=1 Tax=Candidatus Similichlamydia epinepheli TaxID=1903953 RepID=UPI00130021F5|nr:hypothetical protein [Candidatus Similichlamydia epinepheli]
MQFIIKFTTENIESSIFRKKFGKTGTQKLLLAMQNVNCGLVLLGNCFRIKVVALKAIFASCSFALLVVGAEGIIYARSVAKLAKYPNFLKRKWLIRSMNKAVILSKKLSISVKVCAIISALMSVFFSASSLSVFSILLILLWASAYLLFDAELLTSSDKYAVFLESCLFCLNILAAIRFIGFLAMPLFPIVN